MDSGLLFLLIISEAQKGVILRKLSEERRGYERTMDQSNYGRRPAHRDKAAMNGAQPLILG
jgi:hypothetical protein